MHTSTSTAHDPTTAPAPTTTPARKRGRPRAYPLPPDAPTARTPPAPAPRFSHI
jgi:hypothetical protein